MEWPLKGRDNSEEIKKYEITVVDGNERWIREYVNNKNIGDEIIIPPPIRKNLAFFASFFHSERKKLASIVSSVDLSSTNLN